MVILFLFSLCLCKQMSTNMVKSTAQQDDCNLQVILYNNQCRPEACTDNGYHVYKPTL